MWIFFTRPVSAVRARRLGTGLLRETMIARGELELTSYDRLFPNQVVVDECHHVPAVSFDGIVRKAAARFVLGLTATPYRRDGLGELIMMRCGPIRHRFQPDAEVEPLVRELVVRETDMREIRHFSARAKPATQDSHGLDPR